LSCGSSGLRARRPRDNNIDYLEPEAMRRIPFPQLPFTVRMAIVSVFTAWGFYVASHAFYHGALSLFQVTMGMLCCVLAYSLKKWGRVACLAYIVLFVGAQLFTLHDHLTAGTASMTLLVLLAVQLIFFSAAIVFLLHRDTARFYANPDPGAALTRPDPAVLG
jgi:hypothetical protein